jgi:nucleotide-binding universal stress UspA family protein
MELERILVPFDFSDAAQHAARYAAGLAAHTGAEVTIIHVVPPPQYDYAMTEPSAQQVREFSMRRAAAASEELEPALPLLVDGARVRCEIVEGDPADEIASAANSGRFDAVLMSTRGSSAPRRFMIGSVTSKVLHAAELPVITSVHFESCPSPVAIRRVICAIDLGSQSRKVLCWGSRAAARFDASLMTVHAAPALDAHMDEDEANRWKSSATTRIAARIDELQAGLSLNAMPQVFFGPPAQTISMLARNTRADLVVIGRGVSQDLIGRLRATAYDIIRQCPCPVVSI